MDRFDCTPLLSLSPPPCIKLERDVKQSTHCSQRVVDTVPVVVVWPTLHHTVGGWAMGSLPVLWIRFGKRNPWIETPCTPVGCIGNDCEWNEGNWTLIVNYAAFFHLEEGWKVQIIKGWFLVLPVRNQEEWFLKNGNTCWGIPVFLFVQELPESHCTLLWVQG